MGDRHHLDGLRVVTPVPHPWTETRGIVGVANPCTTPSGSGVRPARTGRGRCWRRTAGPRSQQPTRCGERTAACVWRDDRSRSRHRRTSTTEPRCQEAPNGACPPAPSRSLVSLRRCERRRRGILPGAFTPLPAGPEVGRATDFGCEVGPGQPATGQEASSSAGGPSSIVAAVRTLGHSGAGRQHRVIRPTWPMLGTTAPRYVRGSQCLGGRRRRQAWVIEGGS